MVRTNRGGSILGFIVVAVLLGVLLVGGIYLFKRQTAEPPSFIPPPTTKRPEPDTRQPTHKDQTPPTPQVTEPQSTGDAAELPATGPTSLFGSILSIGVVSAVVVAYVRSRRVDLSL